MSELVDAIHEHTAKGLDPFGQPRHLRVDSDGTQTTKIRQHWVSATVPGIGTGAAYAALDAFGTRGAFAVPETGIIHSLFFDDLDDEGLGKTLFLFNATFTATADNTAIALVDAALDATWSGVIQLEAADFYDAGGFQIGQKITDLDYFAPGGILYWQIRTDGADNIAAGSLPKVRACIWY